MGYRLHYVQHYAPEYKGGYFNHDYEGFIAMFDAKFSNSGYKAEAEDTFEVERTEVQAYVDELKQLDPKAHNEFFPKRPEDGAWGDELTNAYIIEVLEEILTSDDDTIRLEFF